LKKVPLYESLPSDWDVIDCRHGFFERFSALCREHNDVADPRLFCLADDTPLSTRNIDTSAGSCSSTLIVPGLLGDSVSAIVAPFLMARRALDVKGYCTQIAWGNGRRDCDYNAGLLRQNIMDETQARGDSVNLIAYSKGCADVLHMLALYPDTHAHIRALVGYAGVVRGSPLADNASWLARVVLQHAPLPGAGRGDGRAIRDLSTTVRQRWLQENPLPTTIRYACIAAAPEREQVSRVLRGSFDKLAQHGAGNDSQVRVPDALLPDSELLAIVAADHWALALPIEHRLPLLSRTLINKNHFPRQLMLRTIIDYLDHEVAPQSRISSSSCTT